MIFFEKKSQVTNNQQSGMVSPRYLNHISQNTPATQQPVLLYDILLKLLIKELQIRWLDNLDDRYSEIGAQDLKLAVLKEIKTIFGEEEIKLIKFCLRNPLNLVMKKLEIIQQNE